MGLATRRGWWLGSVLLAAALQAVAQAPAGEVKGRAVRHTAESAIDVMQRARVVLPSAVTGGPVFAGAWKDAPRTGGARVPVVVFLHGSSGLALPAIGEWQHWLAARGIASVAPDSFALPDRITYKSPVSKAVYEQVHALRASEILLAVQALKDAAWADPARLVLAGTSEGAVAVARHGGAEFAARMLFAWSCEANYFVEQPGHVLPPQQPVLNVISSSDPFFSPANSWLGNASARGHCAEALKDHKRAVVTLIPGAPHTLMNLPAARAAAAGFLEELVRP